MLSTFTCWLLVPGETVGLVDGDDRKALTRTIELRVVCRQVWFRYRSSAYTRRLPLPSGRNVASAYAIFRRWRVAACQIRKNQRHKTIARTDQTYSSRKIAHATVSCQSCGAVSTCFANPTGRVNSRGKRRQSTYPPSGLVT